MNKSPQDLTVEEVIAMVGKTVRLEIGNVTTKEFSEEPIEGILVNYNTAGGSNQPIRPGSLFVDIGEDEPRDVSILHIIKLRVFERIV